MFNVLNLGSIIAGLGVGVIIFGASFYFSHNFTASHSYNDKRKRNVIRCFKCHKDTGTLQSLLCGHSVHESCLYETLIRCTVSELRKYKCPSCSEIVPYSYITALLGSRCCVCKKKFDQNSYFLTCGHGLHKTCLEGNIRMQLAKGQTMYKCPYDLLECGTKILLNTTPDLTIGCFKCEKNIPPYYLLCGHKIVHHSCLYETLINCTVSELRKYQCLSCGEIVPQSFIRAILCSRCCICNQEFDSNTYRLTCGHRLHNACLDADKMKKLVYKQSMYKCPYSLLECGEEMAFSTIP